MHYNARNHIEGVSIMLRDFRNFCNKHWIVNLVLVILVGNLIGGLYRLGGKDTSSKVVGAIQLVLFLAGAVLSVAVPGTFGKVLGIAMQILEIVDIITVILPGHKIRVLAD